MKETELLEETAAFLTKTGKRERCCKWSTGEITLTAIGKSQKTRTEIWEDATATWDPLSLFNYKFHAFHSDLY
jgi:hypothetical protein